MTRLPVLRDDVVVLDALGDADVAVMVDAQDAELRHRFNLSVMHHGDAAWFVERTQAWCAAGERLCWALRRGGALAGGAELRPADDGERAEVSYWVYAAHRRQGLAGRALRLIVDFASAPLVLYADVDNVASQRVARSAGFVADGCRHRD